MYFRTRTRARHARRRRNALPILATLAAVLAILATSVMLAARTVPVRAVALTARAAAPAARQAARTEMSSAEIRVRLAQAAEQARLRAAVNAAARAAATLAAHTYTVRAGQSMSGIAWQRCGHQARDWTGIYAASRALGWTAGNANVLTTGQHLYLACSFLPDQLRFAPAPPPPPAPVRTAVTVTAATGTESAYSAPARTYSAPAASPGNAGYVSPSSYSGFQACVIARESGGNSQVMNSSGHYGLYQFSASTWAAYGGSATSFGHASVAEQNAVFANAMAQGGQSNWSPYDGC